MSITDSTGEVQKVMCGRCKYIIGMTDRDHISIKTGEFFIYIYGGMAIISCKLCNALNLIIDDEYEKSNIEKVQKAGQMLNAVRAVFARWVPSRLHADRQT